MITDLSGNDILRFAILVGVFALVIMTVILASALINRRSAIQSRLSELKSGTITSTGSALRTESLNGMPVTEGAPVIGIALAAPSAGSDTIPVFVSLR